jgi:hypothetical protein
MTFKAADFIKARARAGCDGTDEYLGGCMIIPAGAAYERRDPPMDLRRRRMMRILLNAFHLERSFRLEARLFSRLTELKLQPPLLFAQTNTISLARFCHEFRSRLRFGASYTT